MVTFPGKLTGCRADTISDRSIKLHAPAALIVDRPQSALCQFPHTVIDHLLPRIRSAGQLNQPKVKLMLIYIFKGCKSDILKAERFR